MIVLPLLTRIDHVGIACRDLDAAIGLYQATFGLEVVSLESNQEQGVREAMLAVGPDAGAAGVGVADAGVGGRAGQAVARGWASEPFSTPHSPARRETSMARSTSVSFLTAASMAEKSSGWCPSTTPPTTFPFDTTMRR